MYIVYLAIDMDFVNHSVNHTFTYMKSNRGGCLGRLSGRYSTETVDYTANISTADFLIVTVRRRVENSLDPCDLDL